ncbi:hypothetical protein D9M70_285090 [compost metagenome]
MADEQQAGTGFSAFGEQQLQKSLAGVGVQGRGGFVGDHQLRLADQRTGGCDPLLLTDGQGVGPALQQLFLESEVAQQGGGGTIDAAMALARAFGTQAREAARQLDVLAHGEEGQQVELLEDVAGVIHAKMVAGAGREPGQVLAEQADAAATGFLDSAEQA